MTINTYDDTETMKASCIMSFELKHDRARLDSIFIACGNLLVYFIKLTSISANAFTDSKFKVFFYIRSSIRQKKSILSPSVVN